MERERDELQSEVEKCSSDLCTLRRGDAQVQEECQLTAAVNAKQTNQIAEKEGHVSELLGEVEVLRARKVVMMQSLCDTEGEKYAHFVNLFVKLVINWFALHFPAIVMIFRRMISWPVVPPTC